MDARGATIDRPWGATLASLALGGVSCELVVVDSAGQRISIAFDRGEVVDAVSSFAPDRPLRIAQTARLVSPSQAGLLRRALAGHRSDEVDAIAAILKWTADEQARLRRLAAFHAAARSFAIDGGHYTIEQPIHAAGPRTAVDIRPVVFHGARMHLSSERLASELRRLGSWFVLKPRATVDLAPFEFTAADQPVLDALRGGTNVAELEAIRRDVDPRRVQAVLYTLTVCEAAVACEPRRPMASPRRAETLLEVPTVGGEWEAREGFEAAQLTLPRVPTPREPTVTRDRPLSEPRPPAVSRVPTERSPLRTAASPWGQPTVAGGPAAQFASSTNVRAPARATADASDFAATSPFGLPILSERPQLTVRQIESLIERLVELADRGADHFAMLGIPSGASSDRARAAFHELAHYLEPRNLSRHGVSDPDHVARAVFAQLCIAVTTLTDPARRAAYLEWFARV